MFLGLWQILQTWRRFSGDEAGSGTIMGVFGAMTCLVLAGVAIDTGNAWRTHEQMRLTADAAAHAAVNVLARGGDVDQAREAALDMVEANMPKKRFGALYRDPWQAVRFVHYNSTSNDLTLGADNAVQVRLERSRRLNNAVPTYLLKLANISDWQMVAFATAGLVESKRCKPGQGIYAHGKVTLAASNDVDGAYCIHGQRSVWLPQKNTFDSGAWVSMPDLQDCKTKCNDLANPGILATETNFILRDHKAFIEAMVAMFTDEGILNPDVRRFFRDRPLATDLSALQEIGIDTSELSPADVVELSFLQASRIREFPAGLVYSVDCQGNQPQGRNVLEFSEFSGGARFADAVLITDCRLEFGEGGGAVGSILITTSTDENHSVSARPGARIGDGDLACKSEDHSIILSMGGTSIPADALLGNLGLVAAGDIDIAASPDHSDDPQPGVAIHAGGNVRLATSHRLADCGDRSDALLPDLRVMRMIAPGKVAG